MVWTLTIATGIDEHIVAEGAGDNRHDGGDDDSDHDYTGALSLQPVGDEIEALRTALQECWTLCNTLASLSATHRARNSRSSGTPDSHAKAWKVCWKLCQRLYENQDEDPASHSVRLNLEDLCRDFCQALFDIRQKKDETADSVLRVSFELNNQYGGYKPSLDKNMYTVVKSLVSANTLALTIIAFTAPKTAGSSPSRSGSEHWTSSSRYATA